MFTQRRSRCPPTFAYSVALDRLTGVSKKITVAREHSPKMLFDDRADDYLRTKSHVSLRVQAKIWVRPMHLEMPCTTSDTEKEKQDLYTSHQYMADF